MHTAKLFQNGGSQAVRLPKELRFEGSEVVIKKVGAAVMLFPKRYEYADLKEALDQLDPEFQLGREQPREAERRDFESR